MTVESGMDRCSSAPGAAQPECDSLRDLLGTFISMLLSAEAGVVCGGEYGTRELPLGMPELSAGGPYNVRSLGPDPGPV
jgi:hypothetical protein